MCGLPLPCQHCPLSLQVGQYPGPPAVDNTELDMTPS